MGCWATGRWGPRCLGPLIREVQEFLQFGFITNTVANRPSLLEPAFPTYDSNDDQSDSRPRKSYGRQLQSILVPSYPSKALRRGSIFYNNDAADALFAYDAYTEFDLPMDLDRAS
uniref:Uncharacterized protein n=1 Tax=Oryza rufipogon TaxID=4529 RepID=A0A0E0PK46_ORYRU